jgi:hypothetical protein
MSNSRWTDNQINMVGAQASKFPGHEVLHGQALRAVPEGARELLRAANKTMTQIEHDPNLSAEGKRNKLADVAREVLAQLDKPAESAAGRRIEKLREKMEAVVNEGKPQDVAGAQIAAEIRAHIARAEAPAMTALKLTSNKQAVAAVLGAPCFLSGLNEQEVSAFRANVLDSTNEQKEVRQIENALAVCHGAIKSAESMVSNRAQLRQSSLNGAWEMI